MRTAIDVVVALVIALAFAWSAFDASRESSPVQPDAGKHRFLAVSLLYTEVTEREKDPPGLLSVREVASHLGISLVAVYKLCRTGQLSYRRVLNTMRIDRRDLEDYLDAHRSS